MAKKKCLAHNGNHHWRYRVDSMLGRLRECQGCGEVEQKRVDSGKWERIGSTRFHP